jgi:hypothetical protein
LYIDLFQSILEAMPFITVANMPIVSARLFTTQKNKASIKIIINYKASLSDKARRGINNKTLSSTRSIAVARSVSIISRAMAGAFATYAAFLFWRKKDTSLPSLRKSARVALVFEAVLLFGVNSFDNRRCRL